MCELNVITPEGGYLYQALKQIVGSEPPEFVRGLTTESYRVLPDEENDQLIQWVLGESSLDWVTGHGVIDSAIELVRGAEENGNIKEDSKDFCPEGGFHSFHYFGSQKNRRCNKCLCLEL